MKRFKCFSLAPAVLLCLVAAAWIGTSSARHQTKPTTNTREEAYRANNIGVALLEQFKYKEATDSFRRALQLEPTLTLARINLGIALFNLPELPAAQKELQSLIASSPSVPQPHYLIGLIAKMQNRPEDAVAAFQRVLKIDPNDVGANVNIGQIYAQQRKYPEAITVLRTALAAEPYNTTALYNLGTALLRAGQRAEGQKVINQFQELRQRGSGTTLGNNYLEQGRYAEAIVSTGAEPELVDTADPNVTFTDATATILGGNLQVEHKTEDGTYKVTLFDFDLDGDLDLFGQTYDSQRLYRNDGGKFSEITERSGALNAKFNMSSIGAIAGDYDNDGKPDLFVMRLGRLILYHNDGAGNFSNVTAAAGIPEYPYIASSASFVDFDHDGDLDLFIANVRDLPKPSKDLKAITTPGSIASADIPGVPNTLLRNDGNGKFSDVTATAKLDRVGHSTAVIPTDFNNRRDIDLLVLNFAKPVELFSNQRDGSFRNVASEVGLHVAGKWVCAAAGDVNKDGYTDFFFGNEEGLGLFAVSDGHEKFKTVPAPSGSEGVTTVQFFDYDNDGLLDGIANTDKGLRLWRNLGSSWKDVTERTLSNDIRYGGLLAIGDIDGDGDEDLLLLTGSKGLRVARNDGGNKNHSIRINLAGKVSNRSGIGAKVEVRAGSLTQKLETYSAYPAPAPADIIFGLGKRPMADVVRVLWPAGIVQAETPYTLSLHDALPI